MIRLLMTAVFVATLVSSTLPASAEQQRRPTLQEQALCAAQAQKHQDDGWKTDDNHFNVKLQRCFVHQTFDGKENGIRTAKRRVIDAFENPLK